MYIGDFIKQYYPIRDRVQNKLSDPYRKIMESDEFPFDKIGPDESGTLTKLVEIDDYTAVPVMELISMTEDEVKGMNDPNYYNVWVEYMKEIDITAVNVMDIQQSVRQYKEMKKSKDDKLSVLSV